ncbi:MAG: hypothetical protein VX617_04755 [Pseudomonadota bacterium]|nr:hypothetical protein [Pseudomonadota bacterium]
MNSHRLTEKIFGISFAVVFSIIFFVGYFVFDTTHYWAIILAFILAFLALVAPITLLPLNRIWARITPKLFAIFNFILLASFYYVFVLAFGVIIRFFGYDPMDRVLDKKAESYWVTVKRHTDRETLQDLF